MKALAASITASVALTGLLLLAGCLGNLTGTETTDPVDLEGTYCGTFNLTSPAGTETGAVRFSFDDGRYSVDGEQRYLPPRGGGTYEVEDKIVLRDDMRHTAEFDWTLILKGAFNYEIEDGTLTMTQRREEQGRYRKIVLQRTE